MAKRHKIWAVAALIVVAAVAAIAAFVIITFSHDERTIAYYCRESRAGDDLADARARAEALALDFKPHIASVPAWRR